MIRSLTFSRIALSLPAVLLAVGCATPPPRTALPQTSTVGDPAIVFAGSYDVEGTKLTLTADGEPFMRGTFPPFTPTMNLNGDYKGTPVRAECYFSSVLSEKRGLVGIISAQVQNKNEKTGDVCKMLVDSQQGATLNF